MASKDKIRFSIRTKLFSLILVAFFTLILATIWQVGNQARRVSGDAIARSLGQSSVILDTKIESRFNSIHEVATSIARDGRILPLIFDKESSTLQDQSLEFQKALDFDMLFFTDAEGTILARSDRPEAIGQNMSGKTQYFDSALAGIPGQGYMQSQNKLLQIVSVPIFDNVARDVVRGTVALAYEFSDTMANEINSLTASDIGFFIFARDDARQVNGATAVYDTDNQLGVRLNDFFASAPSHWRAIYNAENPSLDMNIQLGNEDFYSVIRPIRNGSEKPIGFVIAVRSSQELLKPFTEIQRTVITVGLICLLLASLFAWAFSGRISKPIIDLVAVAREIQEGQFTGRTATLKAKDEIGMLHRAVVQMGNSLKEKAELESYLAQISNELAFSATLQSESSSVLADVTQTGNLTVGLTNQPWAMPNGIVLTEGTLIQDRYRLLQLLGQGAMGAVFLALDSALDEKVALKLMSQELFASNSSIDYKEEIRLARSITHRNILRTFDFGNWNSYYYISMEYVLGYDLAQLIRSKGALDIHFGILLARQICSAMNAAHEQGIIHLDLKPANMMINRQGILKIMDFGLAKRLATQGEELQHADLTQHSPPKALMGTPRFMAPEQFLSNAVDERTDIYSIGIILFTLFCGHAPFESNNLIQLAELHLHGELPEMKGKNGNLPTPVAAIIRKSVAKRPDERYQTVREMLIDLNNISS